MLAYRADRAFDGDRMIDGGALVLIDEVDGTIVGVEPAAAPAPEGVPITYLAGTTLLPGLVDAHVHLVADDSPGALDQLPELGESDLDAIVGRALDAQIRAGVTTVRDLGDVGFLVADRHRGHPAGPHVLASGPPVTVPGGHCWNMGGVAEGRDGLQSAVAQRVEHGVDVVKVMASGGLLTPTTDVSACQFDLDDLRHLVEQAHAAGLPVTAHAHAVAAVEQCLDSGVDGIEHCSCMTGAGLHASAALLERLAASGVAVCPTLGRAPGTEPPPALRAAMERVGATFEGITAHAAAMHAAGVRLVAGADAGIAPGKPHGVLPWAIVEHVEAGALPTEALAAATGLAADALGVADRVGRLRPGMSADLVLVEGDPTSDVVAVTRPVAVVCRGRAVG